MDIVLTVKDEAKCSDTLSCTNTAIESETASYHINEEQAGEADECQRTTASPIDDKWSSQRTCQLSAGSHDSEGERIADFELL